MTLALFINVLIIIIIYKGTGKEGRGGERGEKKGGEGRGGEGRPNHPHECGLAIRTWYNLYAK